MRLIYSDVPPLRIMPKSQVLADYINEQAKQADTVYCIAGYVSKNGLLRLDEIVRKERIKHVTLVLGMYYMEGFPESIYNTAVSIDKGWREDKIGEIRTTKSIKYHGKVYGFCKNGKLFSAAVGSHNLGAITADAGNRRQYELSMHTEAAEECIEIMDHISSVIIEPVSYPLNEIKDATIYHEENTKLNGIEGVRKASGADVDAIKNAKTRICFEIPLKVPGIPGSTQDYMKSNINKCYAKGRLNTRTGVITERGWWETEIIVGTEITNDSKYPEKNTPFFAVTDDGWKFLMHASGDHKKNLESEGDLKILGYWLKGRLVAAGIIEPVDSPSDDLLSINHSYSDIYRDCRGVITYEKLKRYGRISVSLTKTVRKMQDDSGETRDVWLLSFLPEAVK